MAGHSGHPASGTHPQPRPGVREGSPPGHHGAFKAGAPPAAAPAAAAAPAPAPAASPPRGSASHAAGVING